VRWLGIAGVMLLLAGLITPLFGPLLGRNFGHVSLALTIAGLVLFGLSALFQRRSGDSGTPDGGYGDPSGIHSANGHDSHDHGHGSDGDH
jgi:hypothetical protein